MEIIFQQFINGIVSGSTYALIGLGLTLIYGVMGLVNFAHGEFAMIGGFTTFYLVAQQQGSYLPAILVAVLAAAIAGIVVDLVAFYPLRKANPLNLMLSSLGVSIFLVNLSQYIFSADPRKTPTKFMESVYHLGGASITGQRVIIIVASIILAAGIYLLVQKTSFGRAVRAASLDAETALLYGVNTDKVAFFTFALGTALAGATGALVGPLFDVYPTMGLPLTMKAFVVVVLGGMGSIPGAIIGGLIIGLAESFASLISSRYTELFVYLILLLVLIFKPHGIFRRYREEKV
ncbi:MAG TPA: branched-chain amino acid ABC transporter permease [Desulfotomaculum sp.]|nr:branched-chain amino acid ABC transporter permease [Desulfotomaculum sp.]